MYGIELAYLAGKKYSRARATLPRNTSVALAKMVLLDTSLNSYIRVSGLRLYFLNLDIFGQIYSFFAENVLFLQSVLI